MPGRRVWWAKPRACGAEFFSNAISPDAKEYRHHIIRADTFHLSAVNWSNIMMRGGDRPGFLDGE